jgi:hypothetical protein
MIDARKMGNETKIRAISPEVDAAFDLQRVSPCVIIIKNRPDTRRRDGGIFRACRRIEG